MAERFRISSNFLFPKIVLGFLCLFFFIGVCRSTTGDSIKGGFIILLLLLFFLYRLFMIPDIYYDADTLYFVKGEKVKKEIALYDIQLITFSAVGVMITGRHSYRIFYKGNNDKIEKVRIFSDAFSTPVENFIEAVQKIKPEIKPVHKELRITELFD